MYKVGASLYCCGPHCHCTALCRLLSTGHVLYDPLSTVVYGPLALSVLWCMAHWPSQYCGIWPIGPLSTVVYGPLALSVLWCMAHWPSQYGGVWPIGPLSTVVYGPLALSVLYMLYCGPALQVASCGHVQHGCAGGDPPDRDAAGPSQSGPPAAPATPEDEEIRRRRTHAHLLLR